MIESTSSCTKASASNLKVLTANFTISDRNAAPGMSRCGPSHVSRRAAMPLAFGIPPMPGASSITRLLSMIANCPSRKKPSRGVVAIQFGLPRPASRKADCVVLVASLAKLRNSFLISNGLKASNLRRVESSAMAVVLLISGRKRYRGAMMRNGAVLGHEHDHDHAPDGQQRVP